jgi:heme/copper-type cytochrome/quinol oxidase subunit 3
MTATVPATVPATAPATAPAMATARHRETTAVLGMTIFIASWAMLFASLFFAYALTRLRAPFWPPLDQPALPLGLPAAASLQLLLATVALVAAGRQHANGATVTATVTAPVTRLLLVALGGELLFLVLQLLVWRSCWRAGLRPETGTYASVFYGLTVFHGVHVLVGAGALAALVLRAARGQLSGVSLRLWTLYLHMVAVLWAIMFVAVYLL